MLPTNHFANLGAAASRTFFDKCKFLSRSTGAQNDYGYTAESYTETAYYIDCGFSYAKQGESVEQAAEVPLADAYLRLHADEDIGNLDRVKITHLKGQELATPLVFDVIGNPTTYSTGQTLQLKKASEL